MNKAYSRKSIREIRVEKKLTLAAVSEMVGLSIPYLSDIERGNRHGSPAALQRIAEALGVPVADLKSEQKAG